MTYVMSDIHGEYDKYIKMLNKIDFGDDDELFVLGDIVDRGSEPIKVLQDMMKRANVFPLVGNHDLLALEILRRLNVEITEENYSTQIDKDTMVMLSDWISDGGEVTLNTFRALKKMERLDIIDYLESFTAFEAIDIGENVYILTHAGLTNFQKGKKLNEYEVMDMILGRNDPDTKYFDDDTVYLVWGHTPTRAICGKDEIYKSCNNICIDCGAVFGGKLACLCLDTMEEFYV